MATGADLIKEARRAAGLTQAELARRAATSQSAVAAYEAGAKTPTVETLERLLRAAGRQLGTQPLKKRRRPGDLRRKLAASREQIMEIAERNRAGNVRIFGSVARGEERSESDIDFLVDMEPGASLLDLVGLQHALSELLGLDVDVISSGGLLPRDQHIREEAVAL